jgi:hypothetical protein
MKIFISWSGNVSKHVAEALAQWLRDVNHSLSTWVSSRDIQVGARWWIDLAVQLRDTRFGVICVTPSNLTAPWLLFEAGALAKTVEGLAGSPSSGGSRNDVDENSFVCPYLIGGLRAADLPQGPLSQFQSAESTEAGTLALLKSINSVLTRVAPEHAYDEERLRRAFDHWWSDLGQKLKDLPDEESNVVRVPTRSPQEIIEETLNLVRGLVRRSEFRDEQSRMIAKSFEDMVKSQTHGLENLLEHVSSSPKSRQLLEKGLPNFAEMLKVATQMRVASEATPAGEATEVVVPSPRDENEQ